MDAAERIATLETEPLPWAKICARYPDQYVCLVGERYPRFAIRYTGVCTEPLIRPSLVIDDETLELLAEPLKRPTLARR